ncbi:PAS domain-containing sensor histidine kinase [Euryhalocaulis sp.]|uniref:PAS domain-containing sensor histidine kinase n=1 Tax=Euryhalocaulis sp. TaxID=2744307 RepID=UPI00257F3386|nr:PAS domain-containing sensor histidine kinase [Euryhalocaulis sp.]
MAAKRAKPPSGSKPQKREAKLKSPESRRDEEAALGDQARMILIFVLLFTVAFIAVVGLRLHKEHGELVAEAELNFARAAAYAAERINSNLMEARGGLDAAARELAETDGAGRMNAVITRAIEPDAVETLILYGEGGRVAAATRGNLTPDYETAAEQALLAESGVAAVTIDGERALVMAIAVRNEALGQGALLAVLDPAPLLPAPNNGRVMAFSAPDGALLAVKPAGRASGATAPAAFGVGANDVRSVPRGGAAVFDDGNVGGEKAAVGVASLPGLNALAYVAGQPVINQAAWRSLMIWYGLMALAPVIIAGGLSGVLLNQMSNIRSTRQALQDSEVRFRLAIEGARCGVWDWDVASDTVYLTDSLGRMLGKAGGSRLSGAEFLSLVRSEDRDRLRMALRGAAGAQSVDVEFRAANLPVWLHARGRPWTGSDDERGRIVGVAIDITEQKGAQARIAAAEGRLRAALESMSESFVLWDAKQRLVLWNRKFRDFFQLGDHVLKPGVHYDMVEAAAQEAIKEVRPNDEGDEVQEMELTDGRWIHYSERRTRDGGLVSVGADITSIKRQEVKLKDSEGQLRRNYEDLQRSQQRIKELARKYEAEKIRAEEGNRSKSEFLANMSHELRTPLNAINGFSEIMLKQMFGPLGDDRYQEYVRDILSSGQHLLALINDILDMSKIEAGKLQLQTELIYPDEIVEQCARLMRGRAQEAGLELKMELGDLPRIEADPRAIKQVILNLLSNAVKFTPEGGRVEISAHPHEEGVKVRVSDSGIGIADEDIPRLARPFEQIESQHSKSHQGSGLGLALSKSLVEMHGGTLDIDSSIGEGTTIVFTLPPEPVEPVSETEARAWERELIHESDDEIAAADIKAGSDPEADTPGDYVLEEEPADADEDEFVSGTPQNWGARTG